MMSRKAVRTALLFSLAIGVALSLFHAASADAGEIQRWTPFSGQFGG